MDLLWIVVSWRPASLRPHNTRLYCNDGTGSCRARKHMNNERTVEEEAEVQDSRTSTCWRSSLQRQCRWRFRLRCIAVFRPQCSEVIPAASCPRPHSYSSRLRTYTTSVGHNTRFQCCAVRTSGSCLPLRNSVGCPSRSSRRRLRFGSLELSQSFFWQSSDMRHGSSQSCCASITS